MSKELDELRQEYAENEAKLRQYQNRFDSYQTHF